MKKTYLGLFAAGLVMSLASCSSDALESSGPESDLTTFTVKLPAEAMQTRAFGDGTKAKELRCAVYDMQNNYITKVDTKFPAGALETTVTLHLVKGNSYKIAFAAKNSNAPYVFNEQTGKLVADYTKATNNSEALDAFCKTVTTGVVKGGQNLTAELKRPTAQINWGTDDLNPTDAAAQAILAKDGITEANLQTKVVVANVPTTYDVFTEDVDANSPVVNAEFAVAAIPDASEAFPYGTTYRYVAMSYVLVPKAKTTYDCTLTFNNGTQDVASPVVVASCPVERNFQTNIYGSLLTSPFEYTVRIDPAFGLNDHNVEVKDIVTAAQMSAAIANGGHFAVRENVGDIDLSDYAGTEPLVLDIESPVGTVKLGTAENANPKPITIHVAKDVPFPTIDKFAGNKGMENITITGDPSTSKPCTGMKFNTGDANGQGASFLKNVTIENVAFEGAGINACTVAGNGQIGGIDGLTIKNCTFKKLTASAFHSIAYPYSPVEAKNLVIEGNEIEFDASAGSVNAIYAWHYTGKTVIKNNDIKMAGVGAHAIFVRSTNSDAEIEIDNNTVVNNRDAIKIEAYHTVYVATPTSFALNHLSITNNKLTAGENGIRITACDLGNTSNITITGNEVEFNTKGDTYNNGEPSGILINNNYGTQADAPVLNIHDNVKKGNATEHWFEYLNCTPTGTFSTPFN